MRGPFDLRDPAHSFKMACSEDYSEHLLNKKTVPALQKFLQERGIRPGKRKKSELLELATKAIKYDLPTEDKVDNDAELAEIRRQVCGNSTVHPSALPSSDWTSNLRNIPSVTLVHAFSYFKEICQWDSGRLKRYRDDLGWKLHKSGHIQDVNMMKITDDAVYLRAKCTPTTRLSEKPYSLWILVTKDGDVVCGECTCVA